MNTLIELYDERAIENILAPDMFRPQRIVYLCPGEIVRDRTRQECGNYLDHDLEGAKEEIRAFLPHII